MAYEKQNFQNGEVLTADNLNYIEDGIVNIELIKGEKGDTGAPGKDGFGTEAQYNAIIARLDELETKVDALEKA